MSEGPSSGLRLPNLDALRGIAAIAVLLDHVAMNFRYLPGEFASTARTLLSFAGHGGQLGVRFFFLLSGYLITLRLLQEWSTKGSIGFGHFYMRRMLRIWPIYFASLIVGFIVYPLAMGLVGAPYTENASPLLYSLFLSNYDNLLHGEPTCSMLGVHWSVAVEEQFYLLWPLLFILLYRRNALVAALFLLVGWSMYFATSQGPQAGYFLLLGNLRYLASGALLAVLSFHQGPRIRSMIARIPGHLRLVVLIGIVPLLFHLYTWSGDYPSRLAFAHIITVVLFCLVLMERAHADSSRLNLDHIPILKWLGLRSYSLYLLHMIALDLVYKAIGVEVDLIIPFTLLSGGMSFLLAHLGYRYVEAPFLRMKDKWI